jgi:hypothetical protein
MHPGASGPATRFTEVTPSDGADLPLGVTRGIYVGVAGALRLRGPQGDEATLLSGAGQYHPLRISRVLATGTDASSIVALY